MGKLVEIGKVVYEYNSKENHEELGLNWLSFKFRWYDPAIGRFPSVDPIADNFAHVSGFNYAENMPISHIDLWGLQAHPAAKAWIREKVNNVMEGVLNIIFLLPNAVSNDHAAGNARMHGNEKRANELSASAGRQYRQFLAEAAMGYGISKVFKAGTVAVRSTKGGIGSASKLVSGYSDDLVKGVNSAGGCQNCGSAALGVDARLKGVSDAVALADNATSKYGVDETFESLFGKPEIKTELGDFGKITQALKEGETGIITIGRYGSKDGHAFNIANIGGDIRILDGQMEQIISGGSSFKAYLSQWSELNRKVKFYNTTKK